MKLTYSVVAFLKLKEDELCLFRSKRSAFSTTELFHWSQTSPELACLIIDGKSILIKIEIIKKIYPDVE